MFRITVLLFLGVVLVPAQEKEKVAPKEKKGDKPAAMSSRDALSRFNVLVGDWRGTGQPRRGSSRGAWSEKANWVWDFSKKTAPVLRLSNDKSKLLRQVSLGYNEKRREYTLIVQFHDLPKPVEFHAKYDPKKLVFVQSRTEPKKEQRRIKLNVLSEKRVTVLVERGISSFRRVAEVGYTRKGTSIVSRGSGKPECVVTGGAATIRVSHRGKTYFVCCSGCRQAFEDDPEGVLADYRKRLAEKKAEKPG